MFNLFISLVCFANFSDTLELPIKNGYLKSRKEQTAFWQSQEVTVIPTTTLLVQSISKGVVANLFLENKRPVVNIKSGDLIYTYILDSSIVKKGDKVVEGQVIGCLSSEEKDREGLVFTVTKRGKILNAIKFLKFKEGLGNVSD